MTDEEIDRLVEIIDEGYSAARESDGKVSDNPYKINSKEWSKWNYGFIQGQKIFRGTEAKDTADERLDALKEQYSHQDFYADKIMESVSKKALACVSLPDQQLNRLARMSNLIETLEDEIIRYESQVANVIMKDLYDHMKKLKDLHDRTKKVNAQRSSDSIFSYGEVKLMINGVNLDVPYKFTTY